MSVSSREKRISKGPKAQELGTPPLTTHLKSQMAGAVHKSPQGEEAEAN